MVKNPPANAGDTGSIPDPGRSHKPQGNWSQAPRLLSLCSRAQEPRLRSPRATITDAHSQQQEKLLQSEARALQLEKSPHSNKDPQHGQK